MRGMDLIISDANGVYIPKIFAEASAIAEGFGWEISEEDREILKVGPEHEHYWETWDDVLASAKYMDEKGYVWRLYEDGDLFVACWELINEAREEKFYD